MQTTWGRGAARERSGTRIPLHHPAHLAHRSRPAMIPPTARLCSLQDDARDFCRLGSERQLMEAFSIA